MIRALTQDIRIPVWLVFAWAIPTVTFEAAAVPIIGPALSVLLTLAWLACLAVGLWDLRGRLRLWWTRRQLRKRYKAQEDEGVRRGTVMKGGGLP